MSFTESYMSGINSNRGRSKELDAAIKDVQKACEDYDAALDRAQEIKKRINTATRAYGKVVARTRF
jgi:prefoldin subunit 5